MRGCSCALQRVSIGVSVRPSGVRRSFCHSSSRNETIIVKCIGQVYVECYHSLYIIHGTWGQVNRLRLGWLRVRTLEVILRSADVADPCPSVQFARRSSSLVDRLGSRSNRSKLIITGRIIASDTWNAPTIARTAYLHQPCTCTLCVGRLSLHLLPITAI